MNKFLENLKNNFHNNNSESVGVPQLFNKKVSKYNEYKYKDIINNYSKTNILIFNDINHLFLSRIFHFKQWRSFSISDFHFGECLNL